MGRKSLSDEEIHLLFTSPEQYAFQKGIALQSAKVLKCTYKRKLKKELVSMERGEQPFEKDEMDRVRELLENFQEAGFPVSPEDAPMVKKIQMHEMGYTDADGEAHTHLQRNVELRPGFDTEEANLYFPPAVAAEITPSDREVPDRPYKSIFVFSDAQIDFRRIIDPRTNEMELMPIHDERALKIAQMVCRDMQPDEIWNAGDTVDLSGLSRFAPDSDHFHKTIGPSLQRVHDFYAQLRADNPNARIIEVDSNHNTRLRDFVLKNFPQAHDLYRPGQEEGEYPIMTYPYLANLKAVEVEWISGYGAAEHIHGDQYYEEVDGRTIPKPPIVMRHGRETSSNGTTASKVYKNNPEELSLQGHDHDPQQYIRRNRMGQIVGAVIVPPLCGVDGEVPGYHSAVDDRNRPVVNRQTWTQGWVEIRDYEGDYELRTLYIRDGKATRDGKEYDGNEA